MDVGTRHGNLHSTAYFPIFTVSVLLLAVLSILMGGDLTVGLLLVLVSAFLVFLGVFVRQRVRAYRGGSVDESGSDEAEPIDPLTGRPD